MNPFVYSTRLMFVVSAIFIALASSAASQDRTSPVRHCLSIVDVNERIDCLESSPLPDPGLAPPAKADLRKQQNTNPSFDCRATHTSIERAICGDPTLSEWDARVTQIFQQGLRLTKDRQSLLESQRIWVLQRENSCGALADTAIWFCLLETTKSRADILAKIANPSFGVVSEPRSFPASANPAPPQTHLQPLASDPAVNASHAIPPASQIDASTGAGSENRNSEPLIPIIALIVVGGIALNISRKILRKRRLVSRYGEEISALIIARQVWQGMTEEQLTESWGNPSNVGREIIRTRIKETWKYGQTGKNRFSNRIYLENGVVIGWKS